MNLEDAEKMGYALMRYHGLKVQDPETIGERRRDGEFLRYGWIMEWMPRRFKFRRAGECSHIEQKIRLQPQFVLCNSPIIVKRTILHEIAHALTRGEGHSKVWKSMAISIGDDGGRCYGKEVKKKMKI